MTEKFGIYFTFEELTVLKKILHDRNDVASLPENEFNAWKNATEKIVNELNFILKAREGPLFKAHERRSRGR